MEDKSDWLAFDSADSSTHPKDGSTVEMKAANGRTFSGIWGGGWFGHVGIMDEETQCSAKQWRYITESI